MFFQVKHLVLKINENILLLQKFPGTLHLVTRKDEVLLFTS